MTKTLPQRVTRKTYLLMKGRDFVVERAKVCRIGMS